MGVGLITQSEDCPGVLTLDKGYNDMSKFLNRILGVKVLFMIIILNYILITLIIPVQGGAAKHPLQVLFGHARRNHQ